MQPTLITARIAYTTVWILTATYTALTETNLLPSGYLAGNAQTEYALHMLCIVLTLGGTWFGLRLFTVKRMRARFARHQAPLPYLNLLRTAILALPIFTNLTVYYALLSGTTPLFCLLITLTGFVFCWPKVNE